MKLLLKEIYILIKTNPIVLYRWYRLKNYVWHKGLQKILIDGLQDTLKDTFTTSCSLYDLAVKRKK